GALGPAGRDRVEESAREGLLAVRRDGGLSDRVALCGTHASSLSLPLRLGNVVILIDLILVVVFCVIGRLSHAGGIFTARPGLRNTTRPSVVALLVAHAVRLLRQLNTERLARGVAAWARTVLGGLLLRMLSGQGTALPFVIVATLTLAR